MLPHLQALRTVAFISPRASSLVAHRGFPSTHSRTRGSPSQDPHDGHPPCFEHARAPGCAHSSRSGIRASWETRGAFTPKRGGKGWSSEEVGIIALDRGWVTPGAGRSPKGAASCSLVSVHLEEQPGCVWQSDKAPSLMTHFRRTASVSNDFALCCDFRGCELKKKKKKINQRN